MKLPDLIIGDLKINPPIVQGGMGIRVSLAGLASAVANQGGLGVISAALVGGLKSHKSQTEHDSADVKEFTDQIRKARSLTKGVLGANIMVALSNYVKLAQVAAQEGLDIIFSGAGLPLNLPKLVEGSKTKIAPIVSSARTADIICRSWIKKHGYVPDAIVVEGPLAGGHLGFNSEELKDKTAILTLLEKIVKEVVEVAERYGREKGKKIPVIAAGGIYDGKDIARMLKIGASGVQMATRFVCTDECEASDAFKQAYLKAKKEDIVIIESPVGMLGRAIKNVFIERTQKGAIPFECHYQCLKICKQSEVPYCICQALVDAVEGNLDDGVIFVGSNVDRVDKIVPVKELMSELVSEAEANY